jgi:hypothetical protein
MHMGVTEQIIFHLDNMMYLIYFFKKIESEISNTICVNYFFFSTFFFLIIFFLKKKLEVLSIISWNFLFTIITIVILRKVVDYRCRTHDLQRIN